MARSQLDNSVQVQAAAAESRPMRRLSEPALVLLAYVGLGLLIVVTGDSLPRAVLAAALGLFGSGYSLAAVLFPRRSQLDGVERLAASGGLSLALGGLTGYLLATSPWGLTLASFLVATAAVNLVCLVLVPLRRRGLPAGELPVWPRVLYRSREWWHEQSTLGHALTLLLVAVALVGVWALYGGALTVSPDPPMTEFYLLDASGHINELPAEANVGQPVTLDFGIANRESQAYAYQVRAFIDGAPVGVAQPVRIEPGTTYSGQMQLLPTAQDTGKKQVDITLYRGREAYRSLHLWLEIR